MPPQNLCTHATHRHRHLLNDLYSLLPHSRKDAKLDTKTKLFQLNELADLYNCNNVLFFEARKATDLYIWMSKAPNGPTIKLHLQNLHTMSELHFPGNCLKGSRPILSFDKTFDEKAHTVLIKEMLTHVFGVPLGARKTKPFVDHVMGFTLADGKIWVRCFQINETEIAKADRKKGQDDSNGANGVATTKVAGGNRGEHDTNVSLTEIGPRFVLTPIVILESSFGGPVIYENKEFVSPNQVRSDLRRTRAGKHIRRVEEGVGRKAKNRDLGLRTGMGKRRREGDELDNSLLFA